MSDQLERWICCELNKLLGSDASEDLARNVEKKSAVLQVLEGQDICLPLTTTWYLLSGEDLRYVVSIESENDVKDYLSDLLNPDVPRHKRFIDQLLKRWRPPERKVASHIPDNVTVYKKSDDLNNGVSSIEKSGKGGKKKEKKMLESVSSTVNGVSNMKLMDVQSLPGKKADNQRASGAIKKSPKFVPLFSEEGHAQTAAKLPGRYQCDCLAAKHNLINNCMQCGRIVCEQEGSGPCLFCGHLVCTKEEQEVLARGSKKSERLRQQLMDKYPSSMSNNSLPAGAARMKEGLEKALKHKEKLLDYDRTSVKRTQVIDDESDYFATDSRWLTKKEKEKLSKREEELRAQKYASRKDRKVTLDFAGRKVVDAEDQVDVYNVNDSVVQEIHYGKSGQNASQEARFKEGDFINLVNPAITQDAPVFVGSKKWSKIASDSGGTGEGSTQKTSRIQDRGMLEMSDEGMCLSMHQPWALLLVKGIKIHEGRSWYTPHRGRLWIAATSKTPTPQEIAEVEHQHRHHFKDDDIEFPEDYPSGCLLGSVDVVDCLGQEEYREKFPNGDSGSPYVFICETPQELVLKFPMKGKHKLYKLDHHIHQAAKKGLKKS